MSILSSSSSFLIGFCDARKHASSSSVICCSFLTPLSLPHPKPNNKNNNKKFTQIFTHDIAVGFQAKAGYPIGFSAQYMLSATSHSPSAPTANLLDREELNLPSLTVSSDSLIVNRPLTYTGASGPPTEGNYGAALATETLLTSEEAVIAAAAAEAVTIGKAALKVAKDVALQEQLSNGIAARSRRQTERKARRTRAAEKAAASIVSVKSGSTSRKKRASLQDVDRSNRLRLSGATIRTSSLLTANEEIELSEGIQELLKLEKLQEDLAQRYGTQPTFAQWAAAAGVDQKTLRKRVNYGILCKDKMIKSNIRLVMLIAKDYRRSGMNLRDLVQAGCCGLERAAEKFDASMGFTFATCARWCIRLALKKFVVYNSRTIRLPFNMVEATNRVRAAKKRLYSVNGRHPNDEELAEATGLSTKTVATVLLTPKVPKSLEQKIGIDRNIKPSDVIADPIAETTEDLLMKKFMKQDVEELLDCLNPKEKQVIRWRFGMEDGRMKTLQEIGDLMGVCRERIRQIESCAFRRLKNEKRTKHLQQYVLS